VDAVEKVKQKMICEVVKGVIKARLAEELEWVRPQVAEGIAARICADVQNVFAEQEKQE